MKMIRRSCRPRLLTALSHPARRFLSYSKTPKQRGPYITKRLKLGANPKDKYGLFQITPEVREALRNKKPVVALESTIYTHGLPYPDNLSLALRLEGIVREHGAVPATIGVLDGVIRVGMSKIDIGRLVASPKNAKAMKVSRRDIPYILGMSICDRKLNGGTTVAATMMIAQQVGIQVFGTGGLGGVHRGGQNTMDISADLTELGRTPVAVISSGCKSFLDIPRTLEYLETQGVTVSTFADGRTGDVDFPSFYTRESGTKSPLVIQGAKEAAAVIYAQSWLGRNNGLLFANPIPDKFALAKAEIDIAIDQAVQEAAEQGFHGHSNTPFILSRIKDLTKGNSIPANLALIESNVRMAAMVAVHLSNYRREADPLPQTGPVPEAARGFTPVDSLEETYSTKPLPQPDPVPKAASKLPPRPLQEAISAAKVVRTLPLAPTVTSHESSFGETADILVFGSVAVDLSCNYSPLNATTEDELGANQSSPTNASPTLHTSNIASISNSIGGVGYNVALAVHLLAGDLKVKLCSRVVDDSAGDTIIATLKKQGLDTKGISIYQNAADADPLLRQRTAQYVAVNDSKKDLVLAMADMTLFDAKFGGSFGGSRVLPVWQKASTGDEKWRVVDANWYPTKIGHLLRGYNAHHSPRLYKTAYEPVSVPKAAKIFYKAPEDEPFTPAQCFPAHSVDLATPNQHELAAMDDTARENGFYESAEWWKTIDAFGIPSTGARDRFVALTGYTMADEGIPGRTIRLLPFMPTILTKLGSQGVLMTALLKPDDPRLTDPNAAPFILSRTANDSTEVGGVYMRLFPAIEKVDDVVSVNGVGDTFLGVIIAGLARGLKLEQRLINIAQRGAVMTLRSTESVSPELSKLNEEFNDEVTT